MRPAWLGASRSISAQICSGDVEPEVGAEQAGQLGGDHPVGAGGARRGDLLGDRADPALEVRGGAGDLGGPGGGQHDVGLRGRAGEEAVDGDHGAGAGERLAGEVGVGEVGERIGAEQHEHVDLAVGGRVEDAGGVEARRRRARSPSRRRGTSRRPSSRVVAPGQQARGEAHVERAVHVAAAQRGEEPDLGVRGVDGGGRGDDGVGRLADARAAEDDGDRAGGEQARRPPRWRRARCRRPPGRRRRRAAASTTSPAVPGRCGRLTAASSDDGRCAAARARRRVTPSRMTAWRSRRNRTGSSSLRSGASSSTVPPGRARLVDRGAGQAEQRARRGGRRRAGRRRCRCR